MKYQYFRLFLSEVEQLPILIQAGEISERKTREAYLKEAFSKEWHFKHYAAEMVYVPVSKKPNDNDNFIFGRYGRKVLDKVNDGPETEFEAAYRESWRAANFIADVSHHPDGQKVAAQLNSEVGKPLAILSSLIAQINQENPDSGWYIDINAITEKQNFWETVQRYKGQITRAEFTYVTPNVLGIHSTITRRLKDYRQNENAQTVSVTLSEPKGQLKFDSQEVLDTVEYISEGGGTSKLKVGDKTVFDSSTVDKSVEIESDDTQQIDDKVGRENLKRQLFE